MEWGPPTPPTAPPPDCLYFGSDLEARIRVIEFGSGWYALVAEERLGYSDPGPHIAAGLWTPINKKALRRVQGWASTRYGTLFHQMIRGKKNIKEKAKTLAATYRLKGLT